VLDHVHPQQVLAGSAERGERGPNDDESAVEASLAPAGYRMVIFGERAHTLGVEQPENGQWAELQGSGDVGGDGERHGQHPASGYASATQSASTNHALA